MMSDGTINDGSYLLDFLTGSSYPDFFFGRLVHKNKDGKFCVREIVSSGTWGDCIELPDKSSSLYEDNVNSMVVGCARKNGTTKLFIDNELEAPVQIIPWAYVSQSKNGTVNAAEFFMNHKGTAGEPLICDTVPLIGGGSGEKKGHIIISDVIEGKDGSRKQVYFLKGFLSIGCFRIQYSDVRVWSNGDFHNVAFFNQTIPLDYNGLISLMMVPKRTNNKYKDRKRHSILDYQEYSELGQCEWKPLSSLPSLGEPRSFVDELFTRRTGLIDGGMADGGGAPDLKSDQNNGDAKGVPSAPTTSETVETKGAVKEHNVTTQEAIVNEKEFLKRFIKFVKDCGYQYESRDLIRFHTCAKCGFFTLLGGEPGTGKSSLALLYAKAIAGEAYEDKKQLLRVDVNPGWMEPADLMGYYSSSKEAFIESEVGLVTFLRKAHEAAGPRMVCFEEMNLAYVEHYFSDFIQQMSRANGDRAVTIKKREEVCDLISLNDNLRFFGTINFDETTKELSARFYDRCSYIELSPTDKTFPRLCSPVKNNILCKGDEIPSNVFNEWVDKAWEGKIDEGIMDCLDEVYPILQSLHIAPNWRKACDIYRYIASRPRFLDEESRDDYEEIEIKKGENVSKIKVSKFDLNVLDEVMVQSILPVYRRPNEFREKPQRELWEFLKNKKLNLSKDMFERILGIETPYQDET